jgi:anaerobic selenocysteine-containing dehydrogenase
MVSEEPSLELNPEDAEKHHVEDGEMARLSTPDGRTAKGKVQYSPKLQPGVITVPYPSPLFDEGKPALGRIEKATKAKGPIIE